MTFWSADGTEDNTPPAIIEVDTRRANDVRKAIESKAHNVSKDSLDLAELLSESRRENYHRVWKFTSFDSYIEQAQLGIGKRQAYYLVNIWDGADTLTIPREELEAAGISKLKIIFTLDIEKFQLEIRELVKQAPDLTVEEVQARVKALKAPDEEGYVWRNFKLRKEDAEQEVDGAMELAKQVVGEEMGESECLVHICENFRQDPNNTATGSAEPMAIGEYIEDEVGQA
jgi:hypothetical protein